MKLPHEECKTRKSNSLFVIVSGHDNFRYAQRAVDYGVVFYLLKPLVSQDIENVTEKLIRMLPTESTYHIDIANKKNFFFSNKYEFKKYLHEQSQLSNSCTYRFIVFRMYSDDFDDIAACLHKSTNSNYRIGKQKYLFIIEEALFNNKTQLILNNLLESKRIIAAISRPFSTSEDIYEHFKITNILSYGTFINASQCMFEDINVNLHDFKKITERLNYIIQLKLIPEIKEILNSIPKIFAKNNYNIFLALLLYNNIDAVISSTTTHNKVSLHFI